MRAGDDGGSFHGRAGQLYQNYHDGMEDQIGALGLVLNALFREADVARISPFVRHHVNMLGRYSFQLPDLPAGLRPLREPGADRLR